MVIRKINMKTILFFSIRILDLISTYLVMSKYGAWEQVEANPISGYLIKNLGYGWFIPVNLLISLLVLMVCLRIKYVYWVIVPLMTLVVIINFATYIFI